MFNRGHCFDVECAKNAHRLLGRASKFRGQKNLLAPCCTYSKAADGSLATLSGNPIVTQPLAEQDRKITASLFSAIALYAPNRKEQIAAWNGASPEQIQLLLATDYTDAQLANAYRNLVIPPLTLGISIFFALLNLAQWAGMTISIFQKRWRISPSIIRVFTVANLHRTLAF
jgi:hypothetical protein